MRHWLAVCLLLSTSTTFAFGQTCRNTLSLGCPTAEFPDTASVTIFVTDCDRQIDAFGFELVFRPDHLRFVGVDKRNTLVENWMAASASLVPNMNSRVRVGGFDVNGFGAGPERPLIKLLFVVATAFPLDSPMAFDAGSLTDDVVGFRLLDCAVHLPGDTEPPDISFIEGPMPGEHVDTTNVSFVWRANDNMTESDSILFAYRFDSPGFGAWGYDTAATYMGLAEGAHVFELRARDKVGNITAAVRPFGVDVTPPTARLTVAPTNGGWANSPTVYFEWTGVDNVSQSDSLRFSYAMDNAPWSDFSLVRNHTFTELNDTSHVYVFKLRVKDRAGNVEDPPLTVNFGVDFEPPATTITSGPQRGGFVDVAVVTFGWTGVDNKTPKSQLVYSYRLDGSAFTVSPVTSRTFTGLTEGPHIFIVKARDRAGNEDSSPDSLRFTVDALGPTIVIERGPDEGEHRAVNTVEFEWSAIDVISPAESLLYSYRLDGSVFSAWNRDTTIVYENLTEALHTFDLKAKDQRNHIGNVVRHFGIDLTPPTTSITSGPGEGECWPRSTVTFGWSGLDNVSAPQELRFFYTMDADSFGWTADKTHPFTGRTRGPHTFTVKSRDKAGHEDATPAVVNFTVGFNDLLVLNIDLPDSAFLDRPIDVGWAVRNQGSCPVRNPREDAVYLSNDSQIGGDVLLARYAQTDTIPPAGSHSYVRGPTLPKNLQVGYYWVVVRADDGDDVYEEGAEGNNAYVSQESVYVSIPPHPDLHVQSVVIPSDGWSGQGVYVEWTVKNSGAVRAAPGWTEYVYMSEDSSLGNDIKLSEFNYTYGLDSGADYTHVHPIAFPANAEGPRWIIVCADAKGNIEEYNDETNNCSVSIDSIYIHSPPHPNLVVSSVAAPASAESGNDIEVHWIVSNIGEAATSAPVWYDRVYLSPTPSPGGYTLGDFRNLSYLQPPPEEDEYSQDCTVHIPKQVPDGTYYVVVLTDVNNNVGESNHEGDNFAASEPIVVKYKIYPRPDLAVTKLISPSVGWSGNPIEVTWEVTNLGAAPVDGNGLVDWIMLSSDSIPNPDGAVHVDGEYPGGALQPGAKYSRSVSVNIPETESGRRYLFVWTDVDLIYDDPDLENNFEKTRPINISYAPPPDLVVESVSCPQDSAISGGTLPLTWIVRNEGAGPGHTSDWSDAVYLSEDTVLARETDTRVRLSYHAGFLEPGSYYTVSTSVSVPPNLSGPYTVFVYTDADTVVDEEGFEDNNWRRLAAPVRVVVPQPADLRVSAMSVSGTPRSGSPIDLSWTVTNVGPWPTTVAAWVDYVYLSSDTVFQIAEDTLLGSLSHSGALGVGGFYSAARSVRLPDGISGIYYAIVLTDASNHVHEPGHEEDNTKWVSLDVALTPPPDLQVTQLSGDTLLTSGTSASFQWTVSNAGPGSTVTSSWSDYFYLSTDTILNAGSDAYLGARSHTGALAVGGFYEENRSMAIPGGMAGERYVIVMTDAGRQIYEHDSEANNTRWLRVTVLPAPWEPPDLVMTGLHFVDGAKDTLSYTVMNIGSYSVPYAQRQWVDKFYLSADAVLSPSVDVLITPLYWVGVLNPGSSYQKMENVKLPDGTQGDFYLLGTTDANGQVSESQEQNNISVLPIHVELTPPDLRVRSVSGPDTLVSGQSGWVRWSVENAGIGPCDPESWYDGLYLSLDRIVDETDYTLGARTHGGGLSPGSVYTDSVRVSVPAGFSGTYYIFVKTDKNSVVYEHIHENNNTGYDVDGVRVVIPSTDVDLVIFSVTPPSSSVAGDSIVITWTATNRGDDDIVGSWRDALYVSVDSTWSLPDPYLGEVILSGGLAAGASYVRTLTVAAADFHGLLETILPGLARGDYQVIVRTDVLNNVIESKEENNAGVSDSPMTVGLRELVLGVPNHSNVQIGEQEYYVVVLPETTQANEDLRFTVDCESGSDEVDFYLRFGTVPDRITYDVESDVQPRREVIVPGGTAGSPYVLIYGDYVFGGGDYTILVESIPFQLIDVTPRAVGNAGFVTLSLTGGKLTDVTTVELRRAGTATVGAWNLDNRSRTRIDAHFDLRGVATGIYDVVVVTGIGTEASLPGAVSVLSGKAPAIVPVIVGPSSVRQLTPNDFTVLLGNESNADAFDVICGVSVDPGTSYQLILDDGTTPASESNGDPTLVYSNHIGVGENAQMKVRVWGESDLEISVLAAHFVPDFVETETRTQIVSSWVAPVGEAFLDAVTPYGVTVDPDSFRSVLTDAWCADRTLPATLLISRQIRDATLVALAEVNDPLLPPREEGLTGLGLSAAFSESYNQYIAAQSAGRYERKRKNVVVRIARDPNEKLGPLGADGSNVVTQLDDLGYTIHFENVPEAQAAAREVSILDQLDEDLDRRKFRLGSIAFGSTIIAVPPNRSYYHTTVDLESGLLLDIDAGINVATGETHWTFVTIDPATGFPPLDPDLGFLPPNDSLNVGQGRVQFTIKTQPGVSDGAEIRNKALVVFDTNDPIETAEVINFVQRAAPDLAVQTASARSSRPDFVEGEEILLTATVSNVGDAPAGSSAVAFFDGDPDSGGRLIGGPLPLKALLGGEDIAVETTWIPVRLRGSRDIHIVSDFNGTVLEADETNNTRILVLEIQPRTYTVNYSEGLNLVSLPLEPAKPLTARSFTESLGATLLVRYDTEHSLFESFVPTQDDSGFSIEAAQGYIAGLGEARQVEFSGVTNGGSLGLVKGINLISLPVMPGTPPTARTLCGRLGADMMIRFDPAEGKFDAFIPDFHSDDGFGVSGGRGYVVSANRDTVVVFEGRGWMGNEGGAFLPSPAGVLAGPAGGVKSTTPQQAVTGEYAGTNSESARTASIESIVRETPVFGLSGRLYQREWERQTPVGPGYTASVLNARTNVEVPVKIDPTTGQFSGAFVDFTNDSPTRVGDVLRVVVRDKSGRFAEDPVNRVVTQEDIQKLYMDFEIVVTSSVPRETCVYQNFPNPFNPSTRIRYQIAASGHVSLNIYNVAGQLVRTLVNEEKKPGFYETIWDGTNSLGGEVASGVYFYRLQSTGYTRSLKMLVLR